MTAVQSSVPVYKGAPTVSITKPRDPSHACTFGPSEAIEHPFIAPFEGVCTSINAISRFEAMSSSLPAPLLPPQLVYTRA